MRTALFHLLISSAVLSASIAAQSGAPAVGRPSAPDIYRDEPFVFETLDTHVTMRADGTGETVSRVVVRVQSEGVARQFAVLSVPYASANETGGFDFVRVRKPDGTVVETPTSDTIEMPSEITRSAPVYSDLREKHLPVHSLAVGDTLDFQQHTIRRRAEAPNQFWGAERFNLDSGVVLNQTLSLSVPAGTYVQVWSPHHPAQSATRDGIKTWTWTSAQTKPSLRDSEGRMTAAEATNPDHDEQGRNLPSVLWTTFHSWAEVGDWYRSLAEPRMEPDAAIRARAEEITRDAKTPVDQARALYDYVSTGTRYVGISLGVGRFQPHAAAEVLANRYGDCKDKDTLLEALLRAKGFTTAPALIGAGVVPVPEVPTPGVFNHVITTAVLPEGTVWMDATPENAPFRVLSPLIRDQEALVIPRSGPASLQKTPNDPPFPYRESLSVAGKLDGKGVFKGHVELSVRSDAELGFRTMLRGVAPAQWDSSMQYVSQAMGLAGKVSNADLRQANPADAVKISYDYTHEAGDDWTYRRVPSFFPLLEVTTVGKEKAPEYDIALGTPRTLIAHSEITLPEGDRAELPEAVHVKRPYTTVDKTYRLVDGKVIADRTVVILQSKVPKSEWKDYLAFTKEAGWDEGEPYISLIQSATPAKVPGGDKEAAKAPSQQPDAAVDETAAALLSDAAGAERRNDWEAARKDLEEARRKNPKTPYLMSMLGYVALHDNKPDEAIADLKAELREHPEARADIPLLLAGVYMQGKRFSEAVALLQTYADRKDLRLGMALASAQAANDDPKAALATLRELGTQFPDNHDVRYQTAETLRKLHRNDEAAATAKKAMEGSDDPYLLNNAVYILSQLGLDLPLAEEQSRRSIALLEKRTAAIGIEEANSKAFADSAVLAAAWDTLAYILLQQDSRAAEAAPYFYAAWFNRQDVAVGNHLGQTYEALGRKPEALRFYKMALESQGAARNKEDFDEALRNIRRLEASGVQAARKPASVQDFRTYHVPRPAGAQGGGTVRLQVSAEGIRAALLVSGKSSLKEVLPAIQKLPVPGAVPAGSPARVLRDGVLYCGKSSAACDFVLLENSGIAQEGTSE